MSGSRIFCKNAKPRDGLPGFVGDVYQPFWILIADRWQYLVLYSCDPHSPWQRGTNEKINGLLRQYFPKGTDLSIHSAEEVAAVAAALNSRPRRTLDWKTPAEALDPLLLSVNKDRVATTA